jgi:hypothetical protein
MGSTTRTRLVDDSIHRLDVVLAPSDAGGDVRTDVEEKIRTRRNVLPTTPAVAEPPLEPTDQRVRRWR